MRLIIHTAVVLLAVCATLAAQDSTTKSRTKIDGDDARIVSMTGCLRQDVATGAYSLVGAIGAAGERVRTTSKTETDVDEDDTTVKSDTRTRARGDRATADVTATYILVPGKVNLAPHVGQRVQLAAAAVEPGHRDAEVTIRDKTTVDPENGRDRTSRSKTEVEIEGGAPGQYTVVSVKPLGGTCAAQ
jgi:hypothetical protein